MAVSLVTKGNSIRDQVSAAEWAARIELAAGHRVLAHYGVNDLTYNHFGLRVPGEPDCMLIKRTDWMFGEVTASSSDVRFWPDPDLPACSNFRRLSVDDASGRVRPRSGTCQAGFQTSPQSSGVWP